MGLRYAWVLILTILVVLSRAEAGPPVVKASDNASDAAYSDNWQGLEGAVPEETGNDNGGSGFLPWDFTGTSWDPAESPYSQAHFIDRAPSMFNNLGAPAFALTNANVEFGGYSAAALRPFAAPLAPGDQISFDVDNPKMQQLNPNDSTGFVIRLQTATDLDDNGEFDERFALYTYQGFNKDEWAITDSRGGNTTSGLSDVEGSAGFKFLLTITGNESYRLTLTPKGGQPINFSGQLARPGAGSIDRVQFVLYGNGSGNGRDSATGERELYFNNLLIESTGPPLALQKPYDCNQDGSLDISDPICLLFHLFLGTPAELPCEGGTVQSPGNIALLDANDDQGVNISDVVYLLFFLFQGGPSPSLGQSCQPIAGCPDNSSKCHD